ncbi:MAG: DUF4908 domain-containing protein [Pseudomonadota bacterium]
MIFQDMDFRSILLSAIAMLTAVGAAAPSQAQSDGRNGARVDPFSALVGKRSNRERRRAPEIRVERYVIATDDRAFLFENRGQEARLMFLCRDGDPRIECMIDGEQNAAEIHLLRLTTGPRGDRIFKDKAGDTYLRIASYGGATVYWPGDGVVGQAASRSFGDETSLMLPFADIAAARRRAQAATALVSARVGAPIIFDLGDAPTTSASSGAAVVADAVARAAQGLARVADDEAGVDAVARRIDRVRLISAEEPEMSLDGKTLEIRYNAAADLAGRPSSADVARFLENTL